jgi:hypothetical protein
MLPLRSRGFGCVAASGEHKRMNMTIGSQMAANKDSLSAEGESDLARIGEMAKAFGVTLRTLRFYED